MNHVPIVLVFKSGGSFGPEHVNWLTGQIRRFHPFNPIYLLTDRQGEIYHDVSVMLPLARDLPGWWSKMELFSPAWGMPNGKFLFMDLDTVVNGPLTDLLEAEQASVLRGWRRTKGINSSVMLITPELRDDVWKLWKTKPDAWMKKCRVTGDQRFIGDHFGDRFLRWQDTHPDTIVSFPGTLKKGALQPAVQNSLVCFHGKPRPWDFDAPWIPKLRKTS